MGGAERAMVVAEVVWHHEEDHHGEQHWLTTHPCRSPRNGEWQDAAPCLRGVSRDPVVVLVCHVH